MQGRTGDYLLESAELRLVVAKQSGFVVDLTRKDWNDDRLSVLAPVLEVDGREIATLFREAEPDLSRSEPRLSMVRETPDHSLRVTSEVALAPGRPWLEHTTRVENRGPLTRVLRLGERIGWFGDEVYAPGAGRLDADGEGVAPWLALRDTRQSYALAFPEGQALVRARRPAVGAREVVAFTPPFALSPGAAASHRARLLVVRDDAAELAWEAVGVTPGFLEGELGTAPAWAVVEARDSFGRSAGEVHARGARFRLPVPAGSYHVTLRAPGGTDRAEARVRAGERTRIGLVPPAPARIDYRVVDEHDAPMAARIVVRGVFPTANPDFGPYHRAAGAANVACSATGAGSLELPPGRYSVLATRGPEYDLVEQEVSVSAERGATVRARLRRVVDTSGWLAADLHLHADPSADSEVSLKDRVTALLAEGVELAVATDHNHVTDYAPEVKELGAEQRLRSVIGVEVTTSDWGHFNVFPYPASAPLPPTDAPPKSLFPWLRTAAPGALIQVNHPRMAKIGYFNRIALEPGTGAAKAGASLEFDLLEVWNGFDLSKPSVFDDGLVEWMRLLSAGRRYTAVGSSDSHRIVYQWAGYPRTYVKVDDTTPGRVDWDAVRASLLAGRVVVSSGPFVELVAGGGSAGDTVRAENGVLAFELEARAPPWMSVDHADLYLNGALALRVDRLGRRFSGHLPVKRDSFLVAVVRGGTSLDKVLPGTRVVPVAFTNPIFVDADGDGRVQLESRDKSE